MRQGAKDRFKNSIFGGKENVADENYSNKFLFCQRYGG